MTKVLLSAIFLLMIYPVLVHANTTNTEKKPNAVVEGNTAFALDFYTKLRLQDGNLFFSPYSISAALAMTSAGARGDTEKQMSRTLHLPVDQKRLHSVYAELQRKLNEGGKKGGYELSIANALWGQKGYLFLKEFTDLLDSNYGAGLKEVDFIKKTEASRRTINQWVEKQTHDKIRDLIPPGILNDLTRLVLTNAIYFKGMWASQFDKKLTKNELFHVRPGEDVNVPMMHRQGMFGYTEKNDMQVLELPYQGHEISMMILLPKTIDGLTHMEDSLSIGTLKELLDSEMKKQEAVVYLPKFKMTSQFKLAEMLKSLGMTYAFDDPPKSADFSGMTGKKELCISEVIHKAFADINEEGTEAAAATAVVMRGETSRAVPKPQPIIFRADHPFLFLITDNNSGSILFMGRMVNPN